MRQEQRLTTPKEQRAALGHALDALGDGSGHETWGPGPVGEKLWDARHDFAASAFDNAAALLMRMQGTHSIVWRDKFIANMRTLAPVLFDILLPPEQ